MSVRWKLPTSTPKQPEQCRMSQSIAQQKSAGASIATREGTKKVKCAYHFRKCADAVYQKLSKLVYACRNYTLPEFARFVETVY